MKKAIKLVVGVLFLTLMLTGCRKYDKPEFAMLEPSQTGFLVPLEGKISDQNKFMSEEFLQSSKVASKRVQIPHRWLQEGRNRNTGRWIPTMKLIVVERKPEVREWTEKESTGTSAKNEGITAESKESIGFMARMNCSAQVDEENAVKFLYRYNNKPLSEIMDSEIRAMIESKFVEECAKLPLEDILLNKSQIMKNVREYVLPYFKDRGITITVIGLKGEFTYLSTAIQESIDAKFKSAQSLVTQKNENERIVSKAEADANAIRIQASTIQDTIRLRELENQKAAIEKWNGVTPTTVTGGNGMIFNLPIK